MTIDAKALLSEVRANIAKLDACPRHRFSGPVVFGKRSTCDHCGGTISNSDVHHYAAGYVAAGGDRLDILPNEKVK